MCKTTTPPRPASQDEIRKQPPNTAAGAVIPLESYLQKYVVQFNSLLVPATRPTLPADVDQNAYKRVAFSLLPLRAKSVSPYYAGNVNPDLPQDRLDDDTDFSASLIKVAALFTAGQLLADAKNAEPSSGADVFKDFNNGLTAEINANADSRILQGTYPASSPVKLLPRTSAILTGVGPAATFVKSFSDSQELMIVESDDPSAAFCIDRLGYGYISAALIEENFFNPGKSNGIWLAADYAPDTATVKRAKIRIPCVNDHPDAQLTTTRQMCRMFSMIRLKQLPEHDTATNAIMQNLLGRAGTWLDPDQNLLGLSRGNDLVVNPWFSKVHAKVGFAGLGFEESPNVYSEGLIIRWTNQTQIDNFNKKIDPDNANPDIRLSREIAVCWQNLLAQILTTGFDGIVQVLNNTISDFLDQKILPTMKEAPDGAG